MDHHSPKISPVEAAQALGISRASVYVLVKNGTLPAVRIGRRIVLDRDAVNRLLASSVIGAEGGKHAA